MIRVENTVNIYDPQTHWYPIENFPGYEFCEPYGFIRSFKSAKKYPYGIILKMQMDETKKGLKIYYILTDYNNNRYKLTADFIRRNLINYSQPPRLGYQVQTKARNSRIGIIPNKPNEDPELEKLRIKSHKTRSIRRDGENRDYTDLSFPSFNIPDTMLE